MILQEMVLFAVALEVLLAGTEMIWVLTSEMRKSLMLRPIALALLIDLVPEEVRWWPGVAMEAKAAKLRLSITLES